MRNPTSNSPLYGQLTNEVQNDAVLAHSYDVFNRPTGYALNPENPVNPVETTYAYDAIGNRVASSLYDKQVEIVAVLPAATPGGEDEISAVTGRVFVAKTPEVFTYDADGNMTSDGRFMYTWNDENRMVSASNAEVVVTYAYDHKGRMIRKDIMRTGSATVHIEYLWDGWNIIRETHVSGLVSNVTYNLWGLDLDGTPQGAGGVGGLLAVIRDGETNIPTYDANGNISEYIDSSDGTIAAHYDYSPFGETLVASGPQAASFTHRFSTKPWCPVTGFCEYQMRKYNPNLGRWMSRDPSSEFESKHLPYAMLLNNPVGDIDFMGLMTRTVTTKFKIGETRGRPTPRWSPGYQEYYVVPIWGTYEIKIDYEEKCENGPHIDINSVVGNLKGRLDKSSIGIGAIGFSYMYDVTWKVRNVPDVTKNGKTIKTIYVDWSVYRIQSAGLTIGIGIISLPLVEFETSRELEASGTEKFTKECCHE